MKPIWIIAKNTFREIIRDRILYGIVVFALLLFGLSLALGQLSYAEQARISADFGFAGIQLGASILAVFIGSTLVAREIEKQTVLTLLARPVSRTQFLLGKFFGLSLVVATVIAGLAAVLAGLLVLLELKIGGAFFIALAGVMLEALLLIAIALFFGSFSRPTMTVVFTASFYLIGHWISSLGFLLEKNSSPGFKFLAEVLANAVPDLEKFNWRSAPIYDLAVSSHEIFGSVAYAFGWVLLLLALTSFIFRRRDFV